MSPAKKMASFNRHSRFKPSRDINSMYSDFGLGHQNHQKISDMHVKIRVHQLVIYYFLKRGNSFLTSLDAWRMSGIIFRERGALHEHSAISLGVEQGQRGRRLAEMP